LVGEDADVGREDDVVRDRAAAAERQVEAVAALLAGPLHAVAAHPAVDDVPEDDAARRLVELDRVVRDGDLGGVVLLVRRRANDDRPGAPGAEPPDAIVADTHVADALEHHARPRHSRTVERHADDREATLLGLRPARRLVPDERTRSVCAEVLGGPELSAVVAANRHVVAADDERRAAATRPARKEEHAATGGAPVER